jgi:hypothetical protein
VAVKQNTKYRKLPDTSTLFKLNCLTDYDFGLHYTTNHHCEYPFEEDVDVTVEERNSMDAVEVLFSEEQYEEVKETVQKQLEADRESRTHLYE